MSDFGHRHDDQALNGGPGEFAPAARRAFGLAPAALLMAALTGCGGGDDIGAPNPKFVTQPGEFDDFDRYADVKTIKFLDEVQSNSTPAPGLSSLTFTEVSGKETTCRDIAAGRPIVLVMTRGNTNPICPYCSKQAAQLIARYDEFTKRGAEVLLVYPIKEQADASKLDEFLKNCRDILEDPNRQVPFPIVLDVSLKAVDTLGLRKNPAKPATYILDPRGEVTFAYVGNALGDRPSVEAMLKQLDTMAPAKPAEPAASP